MPCKHFIAIHIYFENTTVHVEVQGEDKADFAQRMFIYNYRSYDRYGRPVVSLVVLGEPHAEACGEFGDARWGGQMRMFFLLTLNT